MDKPLHHVDHMMWDINDATSLNTITGMMTFREKVDKQILCSIVEERLSIFERFRQKVVEMDGRPVWHDDEDFDLHCHIHHTALPDPGDYETLQSEISHLMSIPLDHSKPLWKVNLIDNFQGGSVIVYRLHHAIGDGMSLIKVVFSLTGDSPELSLAPNQEYGRAMRDSEPEGVVAQMRKALQTGESLYNEAQHLLKDSEGLKKNFKDTFESAVELGKLFFGKSVSGTSSIYKGEMSFRKMPSWTNIPLDLLKVKAISRSHGVTINDVLLSMMTGALRYHQIQKGITPEDPLRVVCPVNIRRPDEHIEVENKIGFISLELPIHLDSPYDRMTYIREKTELLKKSWEPMILYHLLHVLADMMPKRIEKLFTDYMGTMVGAVITNVPGPRKPIYLAGREINDMIFWVPQTSTLGIGVSLLSYNNKAYLGVVTDPNIVSDPDKIIEGFYKEFELLNDKLHEEFMTSP